MQKHCAPFFLDLKTKYVPHPVRAGSIIFCESLVTVYNFFYLHIFGSLQYGAENKGSLNGSGDSIRCSVVEIRCRYSFHISFYNKITFADFSRYTLCLFHEATVFAPILC